VSAQDLSPSIRAFIARYVRSVEQLEILLMFGREPAKARTARNVYDAILSTPQSVERWLEEMARSGLLEKLADPDAGYRCCTDESLVAQVAELADTYRTSPVRVIEAIYKPKADAAQSFADAFKIKSPEQKT
jgi:DNA-binding MarR family transcriptional regulator